MIHKYTYIFSIISKDISSPTIDIIASIVTKNTR